VKDFSVYINFKTYKEGTGESAVKLAKVCEEVSIEKNLSVTPVVQAVDLYQVRQTVKIPVWVQHIDPQPPGQFTGWTNLGAVISAGAEGTLLNHSEHQIPPGTIKQALVAINKSKPEGSFKVMICCKTLGQMERLVKLRPDFIGYEISEFIGTKKSITDENPKAIKRAVEICGEVPLIVGAGIHKPQDLLKAKQLEVRGVLVSSAVVLAQDPREKLLELVSLLNN
jgi:triosephosphate isomerase